MEIYIEKIISSSQMIRIMHSVLFTKNSNNNNILIIISYYASSISFFTYYPPSFLIY